MRIKEITFQCRRDFRADFECEGCGHEMNAYGYDDGNFHENVVPNIVCPTCKKSSIDLGVDYRPLKTRFPDGMQI